jgi:hypothetical protein
MAGRQSPDRAIKAIIIVPVMAADTAAVMADIAAVRAITARRPTADRIATTSMGAASAVQKVGPCKTDNVSLIAAAESAELQSDIGPRREAGVFLWQSLVDLSKVECNRVRSWRISFRY